MIVNDWGMLYSSSLIIPINYNQIYQDRPYQIVSKIFHLRAAVKNTYAESFFHISSICLFYLQTGCLENNSQYPAGEHVKHPSLLQSIFYEVHV